MATPTAPRPPRSIADVDVPLAEVEAQLAEQQDRYVIGRDGVFATLWDRQENRLVVENATEEHCRKVRDQLVDAEVLREAIAREAGLGADAQVSAFSLALFLVTHPEAPVSTLADYPGWLEQLAAKSNPTTHGGQA